MASVRVEGFPFPGTETKMEAKVSSDSEKRMADLSEDKRQDRKIVLESPSHCCRSWLETSS